MKNKNNGSSLVYDIWIILFVFTIMFTLALSTLEAAAGSRPITDFTSSQGTFCLKFDTNGNVDCNASSYGGSSCNLFVPPQPNVNGWSDPKSGQFVLVDYAGLADNLVGGAFGTTMDGHITERPLSAGGANVLVILHTKNAFTWASDISNSFPGPVLLGHELADVLIGADAALGDSLLQLKFTNTAPGRPCRTCYSSSFVQNRGRSCRSSPSAPALTVRSGRRSVSQMERQVAAR